MGVDFSPLGTFCSWTSSVLSVLVGLAERSFSGFSLISRSLSIIFRTVAMYFACAVAFARDLLYSLLSCFYVVRVLDVLACAHLYWGSFCCCWCSIFVLVSYLCDLRCLYVIKVAFMTCKVTYFQAFRMIVWVAEAQRLFLFYGSFACLCLLSWSARSGFWQVQFSGQSF